MQQKTKNKGKSTSQDILIKDVLIGAISTAIIIAVIFGIWYHFSQREFFYHGATWTIAEKDECETTATVLVFPEKDAWTFVCSERLLQHLKPQPDAFVKVTYRLIPATETRAAQYYIVAVDGVRIERDEVIGRFGGCGGAYIPCDGTQIKIQPYWISTWGE